MEIFNSIQGEGTMMGQSVTFIRLAGCNLRCPWCDTKESWKDHTNKGITMMSPEEIITESKLLENVVITGGEPCINTGLPYLVNTLKNAGHYVCIETNGTLPTPDGIDWVVASPKPHPHMNYVVDPQCKFNELKFVVSDELNFHEHVIPFLENTCAPVWLQPNGEDMQASARRAYELVMDYNNPQLKLGIQMHKIFDFK